MDEKKELKPGCVEDCPCTNLRCRIHGNCVECIRAHRSHKLHLPECMCTIVRAEIAALADKVEYGVIDNRPAFKRARANNEPEPKG